MDFVVQNRSALAITGLSLAIDAAGSGSTQLIPPLAAGATYVVKLPVDPTQLAAAGSLKFVTQLVNPTGVIDAVPANNRRSSILSAPAK
jgi:acyl-CoA reductase-like NAD-dependent aldehyde dehydrogenase